MKNVRSQLSLGGLLLLLFVFPAQGTIITFDDLVTNLYAQIPNGYQGFEWTANSWYMNTPAYGGPNGYQNGTISQPNVAFSWFEVDVGFWRNTLFTLDDLYLTAAWNDNMHVDITGYVNNVQVNATTVLVNSVTPLHVILGWNVDKVMFHTWGDGTSHGWGGGGGHYVIDNVSIDGAIPEPSTFFLLAGGLSALLICRRRF